jgi:hypothetical protein
MKVILYPLVHALCLSISVRMISYTDVLLDAYHFAYYFSEVTGESRISIWYDPFGYTEPGKEVLKIKLCYTLAIYGLITGQEFSGFGASLIHYGQDSIVFVWWWQIGD